MLLGVLGVVSGHASADRKDASRVVVERGDVQLTLADIDGRMSRFPDHERAHYARDVENIARLLDALLVNRELAQQARELGLDRDEHVQRDLVLATEEILARHRLNKLIAFDALPDFEQLAHEKYLADPSLRMQPEVRRIQHVLVSTNNRDAEQALTLAREIRARAVEPNQDFDSLVSEFSEDPGKDANGGNYTISASGEFVPEFEAAARELEEVGDVSEPVKTVFGYHIIALKSLKPAAERPFEQMKYELIRRVRQEYLDEVRNRHVSDIKRVPETGDESLLLSLPARYGGRPEEVQDSTGNGSENSPAG